MVQIRFYYQHRRRKICLIDHQSFQISNSSRSGKSYHFLSPKKFRGHPFLRNNQQEAKSPIIAKQIHMRSFFDNKLTHNVFQSQTHLIIRRQTSSNALRLVIVTLDQSLTRDVIFSFHQWWLVGVRIDSSRLGMDPPE